MLKVTVVFGEKNNNFETMCIIFLDIHPYFLCNVSLIIWVIISVYYPLLLACLSGQLLHQNRVRGPCLKCSVVSELIDNI